MKEAIALINCRKGCCVESYLMVGATGLPGSDESSSGHESCCWEPRSTGMEPSKNTEVLLRSRRLDQSIRDRSVIITAGESRRRAVHTLQQLCVSLPPLLLSSG